uniref:Uncharacterized protein n=1 Tax=Acrasis kona TaxID=1008807 RepID=A0A0B4MYZ5_9EUKA|nr:hypothetical protein [Acrasis kona]AID52035.1 hypothetical protein [Acrasis kona]
MEKQNIILKDRNKFLKNKYYINNDSYEYINFVYFNRKRKLSLNTKNNYKNILFKYYFNNYNKIESKVRLFISKLVEYIYSVVKLIKIYKYLMLSKLRILYNDRFEINIYKNEYKYRRNNIKAYLTRSSFFKYYKYRIYKFFKIRLKLKIKKKKRKIWSYFWENIRLLRKFKFSKFIKKFIFNVFRNKNVLKLTMKKTKMDIVNYLSFFLLILRKQYVTRKRRRNNRYKMRRKKYRVTVNELFIKNTLTYKNNEIYNKLSNTDNLFNLYNKDILLNFTNFYNNRFILKNYIELNYYKLKNYLLYLLMKKLFKKKNTLKYFYIYLYYYHNNNKKILLSKNDLIFNIENKKNKKINIKNFIEIFYFLKQTKYLLKEHRLTYNSFTKKFEFLKYIKKNNNFINILITYVDCKKENVHFKFNKIIKKYQVTLSNLMHYKNDIIRKEKYYGLKLFYFLLYYCIYSNNENLINFINSIIKSSFFIMKNIKLKKFNFYKKLMFYKNKMIKYLYMNRNRNFNRKFKKTKKIKKIKKKKLKFNVNFFYDFYSKKMYNRIVKDRLIQDQEFIWSRKNDLYKKNYIPIFYTIYYTKKNKEIFKKKLYKNLFKNIK